MTTRKPKKKLVHLLITVDLIPGLRMHSYVICPEAKERTTIERVANRMFAEAESKGINPWPGIILSTKLSTGADVVQSVLDERVPQARSHFDNVKDFHLTLWVMQAADPCDKKLMELH